MSVTLGSLFLGGRVLNWHPGIKILSLILFVVVISTGVAAGLAAAALLLAVGLWFSGAEGARTAWGILRRMRWLLLSILILYGWYTPGDPVMEAIGSWSPSLPGLEQGGRRLAVLVLTGLAVALLLATTPQLALVAGLLWVLAPLRWFGFPYHRFALRLALTLQAVTTLRERQPQTGEPESNRFRRVINAFFLRYEEVLYQAELRPPQLIDVALCGVPSWYHWSLPLVVLSLGVV